MILYHEMSPSSLNAALTDGLHCTSQGSKSKDPAIQRTDAFLDERRPEVIRKQGISRSNALYAFLTRNDGKELFRITDGKRVDIQTYLQQAEQLVVRLTVGPAVCYVSSLDHYDRVKAGIQARAPATTLDALAATYWQQVIPLASYGDAFARPEVMITTDVPPQNIAVMQS